MLRQLVAFDSLLDILKKLQARNPALRQRIRESEAVSLWAKTVGPQIAKHAVAKKIENGMLYVEVDHPAWKSEIHYRKNQILEKLNQAMKEIDASVQVREIFLVDPVRFNSGPFSSGSAGKSGAGRRPEFRKTGKGPT